MTISDLNYSYYPTNILRVDLLKLLLTPVAERKFMQWQPLTPLTFRAQNYNASLKLRRT